MGRRQLVTLEQIRAARERIKPVAKLTPLIDVSNVAGRPLWLKCESLQPGGAFKIRGAYNMVAQLSDEERQRGVITYSSGNHGQGVAIAARALGAPAVIVMPTTAPAIKVDGAKGFGAEVVFEGTTSLHRRARAEAIAAARGLTMVPPFDHEWIIAGQGTIGLELLEQCPSIGTILVPIGGGGLVSGVAAAIKLSAARRPGIAVIGIEPSGAASMKHAIEFGEVRTLEGAHSIADGLMAVRPGDLNFAHVRKFVDRIDTVEDSEIAAAVRWLFLSAKIVAEPSGAAAVAAALRESATYAPPVVAIISGGNLAPADLAKYHGMRIETFEMERMQSTWENLVDYDMSESGVRPLTLRELTEMGFDLEAFLDVPLGYSQSNGTIELRERVAALYPGASADHVQVTNGTSEANYIVALTEVRQGDVVAMQVPNYMQMWGVARSLGADVQTFRLRSDARWEPDWDEFERAVTAKTRLLYLSNPNNPTGSVLSDAAMQRIVDRCERTGTWLLADEVYLGAEVAPGTRTKSFWGMGDRVIVTSGLSKAYGIPGVRIGWMVGPADLVAGCWSQHDYITIGPNKMSDRIARVAVEARNREHCYARTGEILRHNLPIARQWVKGFGGRLTWSEPAAGAIGLMKYASDTPSLEIAERVRVNQSTLIVPGTHVGLDGHLRIWLGGREEYLREGLRRIGTELTALFD